MFRLLLPLFVLTATGTLAQQACPFEVEQYEEWTFIGVELESEELYAVYYPFFQEHGYEGNGECWAGHIYQILRKKDPELLEHLEFNPEAGYLQVVADSPETADRFTALLCPIFQDLEELEKYVRKADRSAIHD